MLSFKKTLNKNIGLIVIGFIAFAQLSFAQTETQTKQLDKLFDLYNEYKQFNGSVLIAEQGKVVYKKGIGLANMEWDIPNQANTKHRLGSVTKQFTGMLIMQLVAEGKLDLHTPVTTYLPNYNKANGDKITIHHLLTHTSGIPNYTAAPGFMQNDSRDPFSPEEFVEKFADRDLEFEPGERYNYSNSGYFLLGVLIEKITGQTYEQVLQQNICAPLKMNNTGYENHKDILKNRSSGYEKNGDSYVNAGYLDMSIPYAAGSMYSTVEDLFIWDQALYNNQLLPQKYMDVYLKPYIPAFGNYKYAYGWGIGKDVIGNTTDSIEVITHDGGINGYNTTISRAPADKSLIVMLNNTGGAPLGEITKAIRGIMYDKTYDLPKNSLAYSLLDVINKEGIDAGIDFYNTKKNNDDLNLDENEMNRIGYQLMAADKVEAAAQVFKLNVDAFPASFNVYDSYGEALMNLGDKELAIENYKKSIELNPANKGGIDMLKKMDVDTSEFEKEIVVAENILETYLGKFELVPGFVLTITNEGTQLKAQATGQSAFNLYPKSDTVFYVKEVAAQITFNQNEKGEVDSLTLLQGGKEMTGKRLEE